MNTYNTPAATINAAYSSYTPLQSAFAVWQQAAVRKMPVPAHSIALQFNSAAEEVEYMLALTNALFDLVSNTDNYLANANKNSRQRARCLRLLQVVNLHLAAFGYIATCNDCKTIGIGRLEKT